MALHLSDARDAHIPRIAQIWDAGWHEAHAQIVPTELVALRTRSSFLDRLRDGIALIRIGTEADDILGFHMTKEDEVYQMYVSPKARGTGTAQALMQDAERRIKQRGYPMAWLACAVGNDRAARFYEKTGWRNAGVRTVSLDTSKSAFPMPVWRFEKRLKPLGHPH